MIVYDLKTTQRLPISMDDAWDFFSDPRNLSKITPAEMNFRILSDLGDEGMYPGQVINYKVSPVAGIDMRWTTIITTVQDKKMFVDEQRFGPYALWHHKHFFREVKGGVEMDDLVHYAIGWGPLGSIAHGLFVKNKLKQIFDHRFKVLEDRFGKL